MVVTHPIGGQLAATVISMAESTVEAAMAAFTGRTPTVLNPAATTSTGRDDHPPGGLGRAIEEIRTLIAADGGDILLASVEDCTVNLELVVTDANCAECVMPREYLERLCLDIVKRSAPEYDVVRIADPREPGDPCELDDPSEPGDPRELPDPREPA